jgi:hypothetical protein
MWISFTSEKKYAIKIYVGGVNAVSGEPAFENSASSLRRRERLARGQSIQDYVVSPDQLWLDGISTSSGQVRQFVAVPMGSGYSVEAQVTGKEDVGGLQFEITPLEGDETEPLGEGEIEVFVKNLLGKSIAYRIGEDDNVRALKTQIHVRENLTIEKQRLIYHGRQLRGR